jgi:hypothetical protein
MNYNDDALLPIEEGFEMPPSVEDLEKPLTVREQIYATLLAMEVGQSFTINTNGRYTAKLIANYLKITLSCEEIEPEKYKCQDGEIREFPQFRVWLAKLPETNGEFPSWDKVKQIFKKKSVRK